MHDDRFNFSSFVVLIHIPLNIRKVGHMCVVLFGHVFEEGYRHQQVFSLNQGFHYPVFDVQLVIQINITWEDSVVMRVTIRLLVQFVVMILW